MTMIVDWQIQDLCTGPQSVNLITPFSKPLLNPCSYDVTLQKKAYIQQRGSGIGSDQGSAQWLSVNLPYYLPKSTLIICATEQRLKLPKNIAGLFYLKSSRAREGWDHLNARFADPGYEGNLTLEIVHHSEYPMLLSPGKRFGQIIFHKLSEMPKRDYSVAGRYQGDSKPQLSKG